MDDVQAQYAAALDALVARAKADPCVLAAVLLGSMAYDTVWQRSDIDLLLVLTETPRRKSGLCLAEEGVNIHCSTATRSEFRRMLEGSVQGSFCHSMLTKGRLLFCRDQPLAELFEARHALADGDRATQLLSAACWLTPCLAKAEKWLRVRSDVPYAALWVLKCAEPLAAIEVLLHGEVPTREALQQALRHDPVLFGAVYTDIVGGRPDAGSLAAAIDAMTAYLRRNAPVVFGPILAHLAHEEAPRSMTDIDHHFERHARVDGVASACEWLAQEGFLLQVALPVRLTDRSRVAYEEAAYCLPAPGRRPVVAP